eukprot:7391813-Prymnesium_polylepis.8
MRTLTPWARTRTEVGPMSGTSTVRRPHASHCTAFATHGSWGAGQGRCRSRSMMLHDACAAGHI